MTTWNAMTFFALSLPNKPGELARFADRLGGAGINLVGLWGDASGQQPHLSIVPDDADQFRRFVQDAGIDFEEGRTFYSTGQDRPGALVDAFKRIGDAGINVESIETVGAGDQFGCFLWADERQWDRLEKLLTE